MKTLSIKDRTEIEPDDQILDAFLLANTRAYICSLEVCFHCSRVTPCLPGLAEYEWQCIDRKGCASFRS